MGLREFSFLTPQSPHARPSLCVCFHFIFIFRVGLYGNKDDATEYDVC